MGAESVFKGTYRVFTRSARNWNEFSSARKVTKARGLTYAEAQRYCREWNESRTPAQIKRGTKAEFEQQ